MTTFVDIHELCTVFGLSRSRMYAVTYLPDFPARLVLSPRRHRWDLDQVVAYRDQRASGSVLPGPQRVNRPVRHTPGARIVGTRLPVADRGRTAVGTVARIKIVTPEGVTVYPPRIAGGRWRAVWAEPDGRPGSCLARDEAQMDARLGPVAARVRADAHYTLQPVPALIAFYLARNNWAPSYRESVEQLIDAYVLPHAAELRCGDITSNLLRAVVGSPASATAATRLAAVVGGLVRAGLDGGFLADTSLSAIDWRDGIAACQSHGSVHGRSAVFIEPDQIPSHGEVAALAAALAARRSWRLELAVHLTAYSGLRFGELAALRANRVDAGARAIHVVEQASEFHGRIRHSTPKGGKARTTVYPAVTPSGYPLGEMIDRRLHELGDAGSGRDGAASLVFPATRGGFLRASNFTRQVLGPARAAAGWADQGDGWTWHSLRHVFCTTALNDWRLPLTDVSTLAGHATTAITAELYMNPVSGVLSRAVRATERSP